MQNPAWKTALAQCADPQRAAACVEKLRAAGAAGALKKAGAESARVIAALFSGSQFIGELLIANPGWLETLNPESLQHPRQEQGLRRDVEKFLRPSLEARDFADALAQLRQFKQREHLRIGARDLARLGDAPQITRELSDVADVCLDAVLRICMAQITERFGSPYHLDADERWRPTKFCVLGMGKLGGQELNYSSDVDLLFVYSEEGHVFREPPRRGESTGKGLTNHQFFKRLAESFITEVTHPATEGMLFRVDMRLRPEGDAGPLVRSLPSYENFYAQWGQTWERMMLIKARGAGGDGALAAEFLETVQPFRYPRALNPRALGEVAAMKRRMENEVVKTGELNRNVKLGRGGIREIEFIAQSLQLLHAGRIPFLQGAQTLPALQSLVRYKLLTRDEADTLTGAYCFLRDVEHRLQMEDNLQTHTIPTERKARERLARLMGFGALAEFEAALKQHTTSVRAIYDKLLHTEEAAPATDLPAEFAGNEAAWKSLLAQRRFRDPEKAFRLLREFVEGPGYVHVSARTSELAMKLIPKLLEKCPGPDSASKGAAEPRTTSPESAHLSDPDRVLARLDSYVSAYGSRAMLYEAWTNNPTLFGLLLMLFDRAEFLAEMAIRTPDLVDELEESGRLRRSKTTAQILADLRHGRDDDDQRAWIRRYHQAEFMRLGLRDILGLVDFEQNLAELSALADACLQYGLEVVLRRNKFKSAPLAVIGLGKLGGSELTYGSDLDILFVAEDKTRDLPKLQKLATELMELLSVQTEHGSVFALDARLRPDGEKGLLVNTLAAHEDYYRQRAMLWEIQALGRTRFIAGNADVGTSFQQLAVTLTDFSIESISRGFDMNGRKGLACYTPDWKQEISRMRLRIERERTRTGKEALAFKTGAGGLVDAEFIAQTLAMENGRAEPNSLRALLRAKEAGTLPDADALLENYRKLRRVEGILRRWSYEGEAELPDEPAPLYRVAVRCGFQDAEEFMKSMTECRAAIRRVYRKVFAEPERKAGL
ncbi:MAG: bifunctional [glutamate--ammonia ligase]-adenylyl-L-tyrosine phosphorylase/[glutamate--ammonia-ligase] adenylyltransferase [Verrucomicrobia bacterium]|nr:bifunctional [glutamate--ammonia ligase]-adenylyl-L-tyrosine phosphorylase/[glutamate--ammonia-ligase] adenylyltransferase [Verrucomicrobiota bacterium]